MAGLLKEYLQAGANVPFRWGDVDCCLWVADWVFIRRGVDPARAMRGAYDTRAGAYGYLKAMGGLKSTVRHFLTEAGIPETSEPQTGDIGMVEVETGATEYHVMAIRSGHWWATKSPNGVILSPSVFCGVVAAWSLV